MINLISSWIDSLSTMEQLFTILVGGILLRWLYKSEGPTPSDILTALFKARSQYKPTLSKKAFVTEVVRWGLGNISYEGATQKRKSVQVQVSYYQHKTLKGDYNSFANRIRVFVNAHDDLDELIDTALHEVVHFLQYCADKRNFQSRYTKLLQEKSYEKHPMEVEARKLAAAYLLACKNEFIAKGWITRK